ncbi:MAG TPA: IS1595 family transposase [Terriglobales bacterium]
MNLADLAQQFSTEEASISFLEKTLWPNGPICPHCGLLGEAFRLQSKPTSKNKVRPGTWKCKGCREKFTVKIGTIFEDSHIPLRKWLLAIHLLCASKKGMSSHQIHRQLGITYKSAWFMTHRIRHAMRQDGMLAPLSGTVEVDETYVGGKLRSGPQAVKPGERPKDRPAGTANKAPVVSLVERGGKVRSIHVANVTAKNLKEVIREYVDPAAHVMTDESGVYDFVGKEFSRHSTVNHSEKEYVRIEPDGAVATTNTVEGFFSLVKRGVYGSFHHISKEHLHRYLSEFDFRYNARDVDDGERRQLALKATVGKRLTYYPSKIGESPR